MARASELIEMCFSFRSLLQVSTRRSIIFTDSSSFKSSLDREFLYKFTFLGFEEIKVETYFAYCNE